MTSTTIKVPRALRDRIAQRARAQKTTLAGAIELALDESDEQLFWSAVRREHEALSVEERARYVRSGGTDDISDAVDDAISERDEW